MGDYLSLTNTTASHPSHPVWLNPQGLFDMFNRVDIERFIGCLEITGEIQEAFNLDLVKQIHYFVETKDIFRVVDDMTVYVKQDWNHLKEDILTFWELLELE